jgi:hypothetical protein
MLVSMRIASLVPSATEMLFALGLGNDVVAVTHECDYPPAAQDLPQLTRSVIGEGLAAAEIDTAVRELTSKGEALYELDAQTLRGLDVDLIVTQAVCEVCAVSFEDVRSVAAELPTEPDVLSLDPSTLGEVRADIPRLAEATGVPDAGEALLARSSSRCPVATTRSRRPPRRCVDASSLRRWARASWLWMPPRTSRDPGRVSWKASSCSATSCTQSSCPRRPRAARSRSTSSGLRRDSDPLPA